MRMVSVSATQMSCSNDVLENITNAEKLVRQAHSEGAQIILLQELFETQYFCQEEKPHNFSLATSVEDNLAIKHFINIAKELGVVLPISFFERCNKAYYNSIAVIDADGQILGVYRKSHIPDGPGYEEKYYFNGGDTGFMVFNTKYAKIGIGICWDQWFPETARCLALMGAELLFYPTAIGSEPLNSAHDTKDHWQICMRGHAACNIIPVITSNRIGREVYPNSEINFYGSSFICDVDGAIIKEASRDKSEILTAQFDLDKIIVKRASWGIFRDRRPELYKAILGLDGK